MPHQAYIHEGIAFPSVTEVLGHKPKPWLDKWKAKWGVLAERKTILANKIGTAFHLGAERLSRGEIVKYPDNRRLGVMLERIEKWLDDEAFMPRHLEFHVVSLRYKYHGTIDATGTLLRYGNALILIDYKSSSAIYDDMAEQLAAYAEAYFETTGDRIKIGLIVHVSKDKPHHTLTVKEYKLTKRLFNRFLTKLKAYRRDHAETAIAEETGC